MVRFNTLFLLAGATATVLAQPANTTEQDVQPTCFDPPDRGHDVSKAADTCGRLFHSFLNKFQGKQNSTFLWTSDNKKWSDPGVNHLPWIDQRIDTNNTHACVFDIIDLNIRGDAYPPTNVATQGRAILNDCFSQNQCGEVALGPSFTTRLTLCATIHTNMASNGTVGDGAACSASTDALVDLSGHESPQNQDKPITA